MKVRTGSVLPNSWIVVDVFYDRSQERFGDMREQGVVLAMSAARVPHSHDRFVRWTYVVGEEGDAFTFSGRYFQDVWPAVKDFVRRSRIEVEAVSA